MNKFTQENVNRALLDYCERLEKQNQELSKRLDDYVDILEAIAEKITK